MPLPASMPSPMLNPWTRWTHWISGFGRTLERLLAARPHAESRHQGSSVSPRLWALDMRRRSRDHRIRVHGASSPHFQMQLCAATRSAATRRGRDALLDGTETCSRVSRSCCETARMSAVFRRNASQITARALWRAGDRWTRPSALGCAPRTLWSARAGGPCSSTPPPARAPCRYPFDKLLMRGLEKRQAGGSTARREGELAARAN
jgi:hypothetical protein